MNEFDLIQHYFNTQTEQRADVRVGIGDDTAIVKAPQGQELAITTDTLVAGIHFPEQTLAFDIGYKALAVNLSDLAAMGATPAWVTLAITLPTPDENWIQEFCDGFFTLANRHQVQLIGGDLTHGPLTITVQAIGLVPEQKALLRSNAKPGDLIYVTGTVGDAGLALQIIQQQLQVDHSLERQLLVRLNRPEPRIEIGEKLIGIAHAAIDISDGLAADLSHILKTSKVGAILHVDKLPLSEELKQSASKDKAIALALSSGDDYELCFTIPPEKRQQLEQTMSNIPCHITCIGEIVDKPGLDLRDNNGKPYESTTRGYQHF